MGFKIMLLCAATSNRYVYFNVATKVSFGSKPEDLKVSITSSLLGDSDQEAAWHGMSKLAPRR